MDLIFFAYVPVGKTTCRPTENSAFGRIKADDFDLSISLCEKDGAEQIRIIIITANLFIVLSHGDDQNAELI